MTTDHHPPVVQPCHITTEDGTVLTGRHDLDLAHQWAKHEAGDRWEQMTALDRNIETARALQELRRSAHAAGAI